LKILYVLGANLNECSPAYVNPLSAASESGNADAIHFLLKHGANVNQRDEHGWTPLMYAAGAARFHLFAF
jgi:ankyrin repeat protein